MAVSTSLPAPHMASPHALVRTPPPRRAAAPTPTLSASARRRWTSTASTSSGTRRLSGRCPRQSPPPAPPPTPPQRRHPAAARWTRRTRPPPTPHPTPATCTRPAPGATDRRFQPVHVMEPDEQSTLAILAGLKERYEAHHKCIYSEEVRGGRPGAGSWRGVGDCGRREQEHAAPEPALRLACPSPAHSAPCHVPLPRPAGARGSREAQPPLHPGPLPA